MDKAFGCWIIIFCHFPQIWSGAWSAWVISLWGKTARGQVFQFLKYQEAIWREKNIRSLTGLSAIYIPSVLAQSRRMLKFVRVIGTIIQSPGQIFLISCSACFPLKNELAQCILREREKIEFFDHFLFKIHIIYWKKPSDTI